MARRRKTPPTGTPTPPGDSIATKAVAEVAEALAIAHEVATPFLLYDGTSDTVRDVALIVASAHAALVEHASAIENLETITDLAGFSRGLDPVAVESVLAATRGKASNAAALLAEMGARAQRYLATVQNAPTWYAKPNVRDASPGRVFVRTIERARKGLTDPAHAALTIRHAAVSCFPRLAARLLDGSADPVQLVKRRLYDNDWADRPGPKPSDRDEAFAIEFLRTFNVSKGEAERAVRNRG